MHGNAWLWSLTRSARALVLLLVLISSCSVLAIAWVANSGLGRISQLESQLVSAAGAAQDAYALSVAAEEQVVGTRGFALTGQERFLEPYLQGRANVERYFAAFARRSLAPEDARLLATIRDRNAAYLENAERVIARKRAGATTDELVADIVHGKVLKDRLVGELQAFIDRQNALIAARREAIDRTRDAVQTGFIALAAGSLLLTGLLAVVVARRAAVPLKDLERAARALASGNRAARVPRRADDEFGLVATAFNAMAEQTSSAMSALEAAEARSRMILEAAPDGMIVVDAAGIIRSANTQTERFFGYTHEELVGAPLEILLPESVRAAHVGHLAAYFRAPRQRPMGIGMELAGRRKDGLEFPIEVSLSPIEGPEGIQVLAVVRDISERRQIERMKDQFISVVSHELRTPINAIMGFGSMLDDELAGPLTPEQRLYLSRMMSGAERLLSLVNDLLDMSRLQAGRFSLDREGMVLQEVVGDVLGILAPLAAQHHHRLVDQVPSDLPDIPADRQRVGQVLVNLVNNAIKFTPDTGTITVRACLEDGVLRCEVQDNGPGIAEHELPLLFQRFNQLTPTRGGTGLGLSISKAIVEAHGGAIGVDSEPGVGSTFWFTLPRELPAAHGSSV